MLVRVLKWWDFGDLLGQTPQRKGEWGGVKFVLDEGGASDYVVIHTNVSRTKMVVCPPENVWLFVSEAPSEIFAPFNDAPKWVSRVYTPDASRTSGRYRTSCPALPWWVNRDFDYLATCSVPDKTRSLSWVTSDKTDTAGHRKRVETIGRIRGMRDLDLFGRGFQPVADKWEALAPYRYSIAYENFSCSHYWTEKVMDCFLAYTMPIYYGCTNLEDYFPPDSFVRIDPDDPDLERRVSAIASSDLWIRNRDAICEARRRVLYDYNFFEIVRREIEADSVRAHTAARPRIIRNHTVSDRTNLRELLPTPLVAAYRRIQRLQLPPRTAPRASD